MTCKTCGKDLGCVHKSRVFCSQDCRLDAYRYRGTAADYQEKPRLSIEQWREWLKKNAGKPQELPYEFYKPFSVK